MDNTEDMDMVCSIFITNSETNLDISGRVTATCILNTIPPQATNEKLENWENTKETEWRWRFLEFNDKNSVEISYTKAGKDTERHYYNRYNEWVTREVPKEYDEYVIKVFYYYT